MELSGVLEPATSDRESNALATIPPGQLFLWPAELAQQLTGGVAAPAGVSLHEGGFVCTGLLYTGTFENCSSKGAS